MKKHMQAILCMLVVLCMAIALVACTGGESGDTSSNAGNTNSGDTNSTETSGSEYMNENGVYSPKIGVLDEYKGKEFSILVVGSTGTYQSDDFTAEVGEGGIDYGDSYYQAVQARNDRVEEQYGITLVVNKSTSASSDASNDAVSGTQLYDAIMLSPGNLATLAQDGYLCDLYSLSDYIDLKAPWWNASASEAFSIGNKLFFTTGDITIMDKANTWCIIFNKQMITDYHLDDPYQLFYDGTWTFDKMVEMAKAVSNATATSEWDDTSVNYGMVTAYGDMINFYGASGMQLCQKNAQDEPTLLFGTNEASITLTQKILETFNDADWKIYAQQLQGTSSQDIWEDSFGIFYNGRALFRPSGFTAVAKMRTRADIEFGILPMPKMTDTQEAYVTSANSGYSVGILKTCADPEFSAYMLDAFAAAAKYDKAGGMTYEYLETTLKGKSYIDDDSRDMVDYIFSHIVFDVNMAYNFGSLNGMFSTLAQNASTDVRSSFDQISSQIELDIEKVIAAYEENT